MNLFADSPAKPEQAAAFVEAMAMAASAVTVVATDGKAGRFGLTVSAFASVSADPPIVLVCINGKNLLGDAIHANQGFSVNLLAENHAELANIFAGRGGVDREQGFTSAPWIQGTTGLPVLQSASASFECALHNVVDAGTHRVFFGLVLRAHRSDNPPLVYSRRAYQRLQT